jgi:hypothetical protein
MTPLGCRFNHEVQQASASGRWTAALAAHTRECRACGEVRLVTEALAAGPIESRSATRSEIDPSLLFARARANRRLHAEARMSLVTMLTQVAVLASVLGVVIYFVPVPESFAWPDSTMWPSVSLAMPVDSSVWIYGAIAFVMASLFMVSRWIGDSEGSSLEL